MDSDLFTVVKEVKPHVLVGTSTKPKAFTKEIIMEMSNHVKRPIIFPLSNPTRLHEADPRDIYEWSKGKALIATGSPFPPVEYKGRKYEVGMFTKNFFLLSGSSDHIPSRMQQLNSLPRYWSWRSAFSLEAPIRQDACSRSESYRCAVTRPEGPRQRPGTGYSPRARDQCPRRQCCDQASGRGTVGHRKGYSY